jgi:putative ABC transport system permease protein
MKPMVFQFDKSRFEALLIKVLPATNIDHLKKTINDFIRSEGLNVQVSLLPLKDIYFAKQNSDYHLLDIISLCNYFIILITLFGILSSTNMIYNLLEKQNAIRKVHGANNLQILTHSARLVYVEILIALIVSVSLSHLIFFEWRSRYAIKAALWVGSYVPLVLFLIISVVAFVFFFLIRVRKVKVSEIL